MIKPWKAYVDGVEGRFSSKFKAKLYVETHGKNGSIYYCVRGDQPSKKKPYGSWLISNVENYVNCKWKKGF
jgi:hypothetical protein